jgi:HPt (histidine-containing phosphotransfer) domain-containing protein
MVWNGNVAEVLDIGVVRPRRPLDMVHLAKQTLGDWGIEVEVLRIFDQMSRVYFSRLETSRTLLDLTMHLHSLKGASAGVGAWGLHDLAKLAEDELRSGLPVNPERIDDIGMAVEEVSAFIGDLLKDEPL